MQPDPLDIQGFVHALRAPLQRLRFALDRAKRTGFSAEVEDAFSKDIEKLGVLISQMLILSDEPKCESGDATSTISLGELLDHLLADARIEAEERGVNIAFIQNAPSLFVGMNEEILNMVLGELLANALRHAVPGSSIRVEAEETQERTRLRIVNLTDMHDDGQKSFPFGVGLKFVLRAMKNCNGSLDQRHEDGIFEIVVEWPK